MFYSHILTIRTNRRNGKLFVCIFNLFNTKAIQFIYKQTINQFYADQWYKFTVPMDPTSVRFFLTITMFKLLAIVVLIQLAESSPQVSVLFWGKFIVEIEQVVVGFGLKLLFVTKNVPVLVTYIAYDASSTVQIVLSSVDKTFFIFPLISETLAVSA